VVTAFVALLAMVCVWAFSPLRDALDTRALVEAGRRVAAEPLAPLILLVVYVVAGLLAMPFAILMTATVVVFGVWPGLLYAMVGALVAGSLVFSLGRVGGRALVEDWIGRRHSPLLADLNTRIARRGVIAIALIRLTPLPYSLVNAVAGVSKVRYRDFAIGTAIGLVPVLTLIATVSTRLDAWLEHPDVNQFLALVAVVLCAFVAAWGLQTWAMRQDRQADDADS
jgi:phospholipase D1/2